MKDDLVNARVSASGWAIE